MGCGIYWQQVRNIEKTMSGFRQLGYLEDAPVMRELWRQRGALLKRVGFKFPRTITQIAKVVALSPGEIRLWFDIEAGFMAEARVRPGAAPIYKAVSLEVADKIIKGELTPELHNKLFTPEDYYGE